MKPSTAKAKGRETENAVVAWLRARGFRCERRAKNGSQDLGDIWIEGAPDLVIEVKSAATWAPVQWLREADREAVNAGAKWAFVMARPVATTDPVNWVALIRPADLITLLITAGVLPSLQLPAVAALIGAPLAQPEPPDGSQGLPEATGALLESGA